MQYLTRTSYKSVTKYIEFLCTKLNISPSQITLSKELLTEDGIMAKIEIAEMAASGVIWLGSNYITQNPDALKLVLLHELVHFKCRFTDHYVRHFLLPHFVKSDKVLSIADSGYMTQAEIVTDDIALILSKLVDVMNHELDLLSGLKSTPTLWS